MSSDETHLVDAEKYSHIFQWHLMQSLSDYGPLLCTRSRSSTEEEKMSREQK